MKSFGRESIHAWTAMECQTKWARVKWTRTAEAELEDIVYYISTKDWRRETARKIYSEIKDKCQLFAENPEMGLRRSDLCRNSDDAFRLFAHKRWVIIYEPRDYGIEILAVFDGSRRYESFFQRPGD
jgi:plasmid stabilization system protein ParE